MILFLVVVGGILIRPTMHRSNRKIYVFLVFGAIFLYVALRGASVGIDNASRYNFVHLIAGYNWNEFTSYILKNSEEVGYSFVIWIITRIIPSPYFIGIIWDLFIILSFSIFFYRYADDIVVACLMYMAFVFSSEMNVTRQYIAAALFLWAIHFVLQKKCWKSILMIIIAMTFHSSAIVLFFIYILFPIDFQLNRKQGVIIIVVAAIAFFAFERLSGWFIDVFPQYAWYLEGDWAVGNESFSVLWLVIYSTLAILAIFCLPVKRKEIVSLSSESENEQKIQSIIYFFFALYALSSLLQSKVWFVSRMKVYFVFSYCIIVSIIIKKTKFISNGTRSIFRAIFIGGMSVWAILMFMQDGHGILPYQFILQ